MRMPTLLIALILALSCGLATAAEPQAVSPMARVRVAFDRDGITATRTEGYADPVERPRSDVVQARDHRR